MKPRALILDIFGDYLRYAGSEIRAGDLVTLLSALGVEAAATRMTLSRLRQENWFSTERVGRETIYRLSDELAEVLDEGRERIFGPYCELWDGWWTQVVFSLPETDRNVREQLKKELAWLGFGALSQSTWVTPRDARHHGLELRTDFPSATIDVMRMRTDDPEEDRSMLSRCWDLATLDSDYGDFIAGHRELEVTAPRLRGPEALAARTEIVSTYRHFPFRDPSLPIALRPDNWRGAEAHDLFLRIHGLLEPAAVEYVESVIGRAVQAPRLLAENV
jgi:phenylacetic acid degradation operon negative regulatory protein